MIAEYKFKVREALEQALSGNESEQYDPVALSSDQTIDGSSITDKQLCHFFPLPAFGSGVGEYPEISSFHAARNAVRWAHKQLPQLVPGTSFPEPQVGPDFPTDDHVTDAKKAIMWSYIEARVRHESRVALAIPNLFENWADINTMFETVLREIQLFETDDNYSQFV